MDAWLLPEYVEDVLPPWATRIEGLRRSMLDLFRARGYVQVIPPLVEYLDSLLTGVGSDLDLRTFKLVDQLSGRLLGVRADIAPQVARIDAHLLNSDGVTRLCYAGEVLTTLPQAMSRSREQFQVGAELYGYSGIEADLEILRLAVAALALCELADVRVDVGHVGLFAALARRVGLEGEDRAQVFRALQAKDVPALRELCRKLPDDAARALVALPELYGDVAVLAEAKRILPTDDTIVTALAGMERIAAGLDGVNLGFDLAEVRGAEYHSGIVFAAYAGGYSAAVALGGRYDNVGAAFGRARPATGFSLDLREIAAGIRVAEPSSAIFAPAETDAALQATIAALRCAGQVVIVCLPGETAPVGSRTLRRSGGDWQIQKT